MAVRRRRGPYFWAAFLGMLVAGFTTAALHSDNLSGPLLLVYPAGALAGIAVVRVFKMRRGYAAAWRVERWRSAAEVLRVTDPDAYEQILAQAKTDPAATVAASHDPDAYVAIFLSYANEEGV